MVKQLYNRTAYVSLNNKLFRNAVEFNYTSFLKHVLYCLTYEVVNIV